MRVHVTRSGIGGVYGHPVTRCDAGGCAAGTEFYYADLVPSQFRDGDLALVGDAELPAEEEPILSLDLSVPPAPEPIACRNCGSPACEWPGECKPAKTTAEALDAQDWSERIGELDTACRGADGTRARQESDNATRWTRYTVPDGSVLTMSGDSWDLGYPGCFCWQGVGHDAVCTAPLDAPEEVLDILNDLIKWDAYVGPFENEVWDRARAIRDRLVVK